jgi:hypothetical protein
MKAVFVNYTFHTNFFRLRHGEGDGLGLTLTLMDQTAARFFVGRGSNLHQYRGCREVYVYSR